MRSHLASPAGRRVLTLAACSFAALASLANPTPPAGAPPAPPAQAAPATAAATATPDDASFDQAAAVAKLRKELTGKEQKPASEVFKNIKMFNKMPAERLLKIMEFGWSRALGVKCTHCHVADEWESDEKRPKLAAREMGAFTGKLNQELLPTVKNLREGTPPPTVNCTTCHRGQVKPALDMPN